jgi:hypothetical protein
MGTLKWQYSLCPQTADSLHSLHMAILNPSATRMFLLFNWIFLLYFPFSKQTLKQAGSKIWKLLPKPAFLFWKISCMFVIASQKYLHHACTYVCMTLRDGAMTYCFSVLSHPWHSPRSYSTSAGSGGKCDCLGILLLYNYQIIIIIIIILTELVLTTSAHFSVLICTFVSEKSAS